MTSRDGRMWFQDRFFTACRQAVARENDIDVGRETTSGERVDPLWWGCSMGQVAARPHGAGRKKSRVPVP